MILKGIMVIKSMRPVPYRAYKQSLLLQATGKAYAPHTQDICDVD